MHSGNKKHFLKGAGAIPIKQRSSDKRLPGQFAREAAFFDVEEREEEKAGYMRYPIRPAAREGGTARNLPTRFVRHSSIADASDFADEPDGAFWRGCWDYVKTDG
jgi:hypothetical protein